MNAYLFSPIQSAAYGNLFECATHEANGCDVVFSSMSHENEVGVMDDGEELLFASLLNTEGLKAKFPKLATEDGLVVRHPKNDLTAIWLCWASYYRLGEKVGKAWSEGRVFMK